MVLAIHPRDISSEVKETEYEMHETWGQPRNIFFWCSSVIFESSQQRQQQQN